MRSGGIIAIARIRCQATIYMSYSIQVRAAVLLLCVPAAALTIAAACGRAPDRPGAEGSAFPALIGKYAGNDACSDCHRREHAEHGASRHMATLKAADARSLGPLAPPVGQIPGNKYRIKALPSGFQMAADGHPELSRRIDLAIGSGKFGLTYMSVTSD